METGALCALIQCITKLEVEDDYASAQLVSSQEVLEENRFLAARDGMAAELIDPGRKLRVPPARDLGCECELAGIRSLAKHTGADRQLERARQPGRLQGLVSSLAEALTRPKSPSDEGSS